MFMVGQNNEFYGAANSYDVKLRDIMIEDTKEKNEDVEDLNMLFLQKGWKD